jgi:hypothetical protein
MRLRGQASTRRGLLAAVQLAPVRADQRAVGAERRGIGPGPPERGRQWSEPGPFLSGCVTLAADEAWHRVLSGLDSQASAAARAALLHQLS